LPIDTEEKIWKNKIRHPESYVMLPWNDMSLLTQGLNYHSACDTVGMPSENYKSTAASTT